MAFKGMMKKKYKKIYLIKEKHLEENVVFYYKNSLNTIEMKYFKLLNL